MRKWPVAGITEGNTAVDIENLSTEQKAKLGECESPEDILAVARAEGYELSEEELDQIAGGTPVWVVTNMWTCKKCGGRFKYLETDRDYKRYQCTKCGQLYNWK